MDRITRKLLKLGLNPSLKGFGAARDCIAALVKSGPRMHQLSMSKEVYPDAARVRGVKAHQVERNIRWVVEDAFKKPTPDLREMFSYWLYRTRATVPNRTFLYTVAECLRTDKSGEGE